jgi:hypothetical protein
MAIGEGLGGAESGPGRLNEGVMGGADVASRDREAATLGGIWTDLARGEPPVWMGRRRLSSKASWHQDGEQALWIR